MRRRRLIGVYRGFVKSMGMPWLHFRTSRSAAATRAGNLLRATQFSGPSAPRKLTEGDAEYNRHRPARPLPQRQCAPPNAVALTGHPRYARRQAICGVPRARAKPNAQGKHMTTFDKREEAFEKQFAHDEELKFKATARRNKLLGLWAAEKLGLSGADADSYALSVVMAAFEEGDHDVARKIRKDFDAKGVAQSDHQIARTMNDLMAKAVADVQAGR